MTIWSSARLPGQVSADNNASAGCVNARGPRPPAAHHSSSRRTRQQRHVFGAIAERRQIDAGRSEPPVQVAAEAPGLDFALDAGRAVPACRCRARHPTDVGGHRLAVDPHFAVAGHARDARLQGRGQVRDVFRNSVPPRAAAIRLSRAAHSRSGRDHGGRRAEQQPVEPGGIGGSAVHTLENAGWSARLLVQLAGDRLDVRPAWRQQQDAALGERRAAHEVLHTRDGRRPSHELARAARTFPRPRGPKCESTSVIVSGMAGLKKGIQLRPVTHRPSDDGASEAGRLINTT